MYTRVSLCIYMHRRNADPIVTMLCSAHVYYHYCTGQSLWTCMFGHTLRSVSLIVLQLLTLLGLLIRLRSYKAVGVVRTCAARPQDRQVDLYQDQ